MPPIRSAIAATRTLRSAKVSPLPPPAPTPTTKPIKKPTPKPAKKPATPKHAKPVTPHPHMKTTTDASGTTRCAWCTSDPLYLYYHDHEWGVPVQNDDRLLFELVCLEGAQAGLNWLTILKKRQAYKIAFDNFDPRLVAAYGDDKIAVLVADASIIRNKLKISSAIENAKAFLKVQGEFGSFGKYLWQFAPKGGPLVEWKEGECRATSLESENMSKDLKGRGFRFVGPTICYALMQSIGMVDDHHPDCFRYAGKEGKGDEKAKDANDAKDAKDAKPE
ncbi:hypothetical protein HDU98_009973 [Podochytrium sp. JEL0797]|nr:hypothetical protein HDU98_009973 [Podochytrium sp. JEL0797]